MKAWAVSNFLLMANCDHSPINCPTCGKPIIGPDGLRAAYLSGGAVPEAPGGGYGRLADPIVAFLNIGVITERVGIAKPDIPIVERLADGQFHLQWCSVNCMRDWFLKLFREMEQQSGDVAG
jgi:hypothetical protein